jgi:small subunit ribosomal protein S8e
MAIVQSRSLRKPTGGRYKSTNPKRLHQKANSALNTEIGSQRIKVRPTKGGSTKFGVLRTETINVYDPKKKKHFTAKLEVVKESGANRNYVRRNIMTKGTIVKTDKGLAKITSRPGQDKVLNGILQGD